LREPSRTHQGRFDGYWDFVKGDMESFCLSHEDAQDVETENQGGITLEPSQVGKWPRK